MGTKYIRQHVWLRSQQKPNQNVFHLDQTGYMPMHLDESVVAYNKKQLPIGYCTPGFQTP